MTLLSEPGSLRSGPVRRSLDRLARRFARRGCSLRRAAVQSAGAGVNTVISWDTEDVDIGGYWASGTNIVVPHNEGGVYATQATVVGAAVLGVDARMQVSLNGTVQLRAFNSISATFQSCGAVLPLKEADVVTVEVFNNTAGAVNVTATVHFYKVSE